MCPPINFASRSPTYVPPTDCVIKRVVVSDIATVFDVLGWFSLVTVKMKILLQRILESKVGWDDPVHSDIYDIWQQWKSELPTLATMHIPRCYSPTGVMMASVLLHGFSDASEEAYARVVYLRMVNSLNNVHTLLVLSKTKVSLIKQLSIPRFSGRSRGVS